MDFIPTEVNTDAPGGDAEQEVWAALKRAFSSNEPGVAYHRCPIIDKKSGEFDREADIVLLNQELGLVVIECKGYLIDQIESIQGQVWKLTGINQQEARPYTQARDQGFNIQYFLKRENKLNNAQGQCKVPMNVFVATPNISREEWESRDFHELPTTPRMLTADELSPQSLREKLDDAPKMEPLTEDEYETARSVLSGGTVLDTKGVAAPPEPKTRGDLYKVVEEATPKLERKQEEIGLQMPPGPQQVRGIAGSGKTVLMAMKAAQMHKKHPEWDIGVTFFTKSLYPHLRTKIREYYDRYTSGGEPNESKLRVLHGWGGRTVAPGMYYTLASGSETHDFLHSGAAEDQFGRDIKPPDLLELCCGELLETGDVPKKFDAILIDEAQDFQPNFYKMCRAALRDPERLVWAYDEAQSLNTLTAPSPRNIFGEEDGEPAVDLSGSYEQGIQKSQIMRKSYRSPREVLMAAHYFGMGLKRDRGVVQTITTQDGWQNIGYEVVKGDFRRIGEPVEIRRPEGNSPHPLADHDEARPFVRFEAANSKSAEMAHVAERIQRDVLEGDFRPEQIMVILLGANNKTERDRHAALLNSELSEEITMNRVWEGETSVFKQEGEVTVTRINRAKGNEAPMVYLTGLEYVDEPSPGKSLVQRRNKAFVGMTRTRAWCTTTGTGDCDAFDELREVLDDVAGPEPKMVFPAPDPQSLENEMEENIEDYTLRDFSDD